MTTPFDTTFGPSTPGAINLISGKTKRHLGCPRRQWRHHPDRRYRSHRRPLLRIAVGQQERRRLHGYDQSSITRFFIEDTFLSSQRIGGGRSTASPDRSAARSTSRTSLLHPTPRRAASPTAASSHSRSQTTCRLLRSAATRAYSPPQSSCRATPSRRVNVRTCSSTSTASPVRRSICALVLSTFSNFVSRSRPPSPHSQSRRPCTPSSASRPPSPRGLSR